jgi:hypothetical protein
MTTIYLVKSSETLDDDEVVWENLRAFKTRKKAEQYAQNTRNFILTCDDLDNVDEVTIEEIYLED